MREAINKGDQEQNPTFSENDAVIDSIDEPLYYDDPVLTFEDSMIYGCTLELDLNELQDFCNKYKWKNLMIFQNLF